MKENIIAFQDADGSIRRKLTALVEQVNKDYPERNISMSAVIRELLAYAFTTYRAPTMQDKLTRGSLKK